LKTRRRNRIKAQPFPQAWRAIIAAKLPYVEALPEPLQEELFDLTQIFLAEKHFEGCAGFEITDEVRVTIACQACVLLLNRPTDIYPRLATILVYESPYFARQEHPDEAGLISLSHDVRAGESWSRGVVVLVWKEILQGLRHPHDGYNVIIHEFAHQLDQENNAAEGLPLLDHASLYPRWQHAFSEQYDRLLRDVKHHRKSVFSDYGATNPAEFFAVATETFFEEATKLKRRHPELYDVLSDYFQQDPARYAPARK
jgi:MtfA peptidase